MNENGKTVAELAEHAGGQVVGEGGLVIRGLAALDRAEENDISFVEDVKLLEDARRSNASCLIVPETFPNVDGKCLIRVAKPKLAFALLAELLHPPTRREPSIHPTAILAASAKVGGDVFIGAYAFISERTVVGERTQIHSGVRIGEDVAIGSDCVIHPNVVVYDGARLGDRVILHAGAVIGADGFGYVRDEAGYHKFPQIGSVEIDDDVEVGAATCVDRGSLGVTRIGPGSKIDNLVQIAHNVQIGARVVIASQTGISGSTVIEDDAVIGGQVGMGDHARVQRGAVIGSKAGILPGKIVRPGVWWGIPVQRLEDYKRLNAHVNRLPQLREEVKELQRRIKELEKEKTNDE
jgi:UDP-3-O-[3-hydroxymyristoyl] glucosamine N-acyltransferase